MTREPVIETGTAGSAGRATVQQWCEDYILSIDAEHKLVPPAPPKVFAHLGDESTPAPQRPGRPPDWDVVQKSERTIPKKKLVHRHWQARLFHTFLQHELQAAELMAWAVLAFPDTPIEFRRGLMGICRDELRHMAHYREHLRWLGFEFGDFPVRDWFWTRVPQCQTAVQFVALMGMGLEGGNLDHTDRYCQWFADLGEHRAANLQGVVHREEIPHVSFAVRWFRRWTGGLEFARWAESLVPPLTPSLLRGRSMHRGARERAGMDPAFLDALDRA